jgi:K+-sensing histidine kinase KdpD
MVDEHLIARVIDNILSNALKFSPPYTEISVELSRIDRDQRLYVLFKFLDQGPGVSIEYQVDIFDKYKVVELKKAGVSQIGLGLFFCKLVIEAHGGRIWYENNVPLGSIFCFEIPADLCQ